MNMSDLANMAKARAADHQQQHQQQHQDQGEDGLDLKTPTQEDLDGLPSGSDGSSSGYGSQTTVRVEDQGYADGKLDNPGYLLCSFFTYCSLMLLQEGSYSSMCPSLHLPDCS